MQNKARGWMAGCAAGIVVLVNLLTGLIGGRYPFGAYTRNINDMWQQFIPFHLHLRDILTGPSESNFLFNWSIGGGTSFVGDYGTYLSSPFTLLVVLFPRDQIEITMWVIVTLKMAVAAALMVYFLRAIQPGPSWALVFLGAAYGLCGWAMDDASYVPMWLDGLLGLPLLSLAAFWTLERRRPILGIVAIAFVWWSNYYTAYMASIAAATVLLTLIVIRRHKVGQGLLTMLRFTGQGIIGVGLTGILLVPTFLAVSNGTPNATSELRPVPSQFFAERVLSGTEGVGRSPSLSVGMLALLLALGLPWLAPIERRTRVALTVGIVLTMVSMNLHATHSVWHLFSSPNGSQFRQAFVGSFWLVLLAWFAVGVEWTRLALVASVASLAGIVVVAALGPQSFTTAWTWWTAGGAIMIGAGLAIVWDRLRAESWRPLAARLAIFALGAALVVELTGTYLITQQGQDDYLYRPSDAHSDELMRSFEGILSTPSPWPEGRRIIRNVDNLNPGALLGVQGLGYYSSLTPLSVSEAVKALGFQFLRSGRSFSPSPDSVSWSMMSASSLVTEAGETIVPALPMIRVQNEATVLGSDVWENRAAYFNGDLYRVPKVEIATEESPYSAFEGPRVVQGESTARLRVGCESDEIGQLLLSSASDVEVTDVGGRNQVPQVYPGVGVVQAEQPGEAEFLVASQSDISLTAHPAACANLGTLTAATQVLAPTQSSISGGTIRATFEEPVTDFITISTFFQRGWTCSLDGEQAEIVNSAGLLTVDASDSTELVCNFIPPGLKSGVLLSFISGVALALVTFRLGGFKAFRLNSSVRKGERRHSEGRRNGGNPTQQGSE